MPDSRELIETLLKTGLAGYKGYTEGQEPATKLRGNIFEQQLKNLLVPQHERRLAESRSKWYESRATDKGGNDLQREIETILNLTKQYPQYFGKPQISYDTKQGIKIRTGKPEKEKRLNPALTERVFMSLVDEDKSDEAFQADMAELIKNAKGYEEYGVDVNDILMRAPELRKTKTKKGGLRQFLRRRFQ